MNPVVMTTRFDAESVFADGHRDNGIGRLELRYDPADPFAVAVVFHSTACPVEWLLAREVLDAAQHGAAGCGDVTAGPTCDGRIRIELTSREGTATVHLPAADVRAFLICTYEQVPAGLERIGWDDWLAAVLNRSVS